MLSLLQELNIVPIALKAFSCSMSIDWRGSTNLEKSVKFLVKNVSQKCRSWHSRYLPSMLYLDPLLRLSAGEDNTVREVNVGFGTRRTDSFTAVRAPASFANL